MSGIIYSKAVDIKWQQIWRDTGIYKFNENEINRKFYLLEMFSYPSGANLHVGHWWNYGLSDSYGRFKRMRGYELFHPVGFDAFGLPAENYAIKTGVHPKDSTEKNIATMREQFRAMGTTYDWDYEITTCDADYFKWTQWLFIQLYKRGLAYRKEAPVNWCPSCMTVLSNEQSSGGICERCDSEVTRKNMTQWFFKITDYAEELLTTIDQLDWPDKTKQIQKNWIGKSDDGYRLRDWSVSRQRYWGCPIPIVYCEDCGIEPVPERDLPIALPYNVKFTSDGQSPLRYHDAFLNTVCPKCEKPAMRETDTLDTFVCSSWYYLRFYDRENENAPFDEERASQIMPVDKYIGGIEHAAMHLLYARFITKALRDMGHIKIDEPFPSLFHQGIILGKDGKRMSKRNGALSPDSLIDQYGADVFRMYLGFGFSYEDGGIWDDNGIKAIARFVSRVSKRIEDFVSFRRESGANSLVRDQEADFARNTVIRHVTADYERLSFNTAIARVMELLNAIQKYQASENRNAAFEETLIVDLVLLLAPMAPHYCEELWEFMGFPYSAHSQSFPACDESKLNTDTINIAVQVNGVLRDVITVWRDAEEGAVKSAALGASKVKRAIGTKSVKKVIYVKDRIVNIVL